MLFLVQNILVLNQNVRVENLVTEIVKLHTASLERMLLGCLLLRLRLLVRHYDAFLEEVGGRDDRVGVQLPVLLDRLDAFKLILCVYARPDVGVSGALFNSVARLLAAETLLVDFLLLVVIHLLFLFFLLLFALVLAELATGLLLGRLTAAPPNFARVLTLMRPATPVVVLLLDVVFAALLANLLRYVEPAPPHLELLDAFLHLLLLQHDALLFFLEQGLLLEDDVDFFLAALDLAFHLIDLLLESVHHGLLLFGELVFGLEQVAGVLAELVPLGEDFFHLAGDVALLSVEILDVGLEDLHLVQVLVLQILRVRNRLDGVVQQVELLLQNAVLHLVEVFVLFQLEDLVLKSVVVLHRLLKLVLVLASQVFIDVAILLKDDLILLKLGDKLL